MYSDNLFSFLGLSINFYNIMILVGVIACFIFTSIAMKKSGYSASASDTILIIGIFAIVIGLLSAALFQAFYNLIAGNGFVFEGMTFIGGLIGGVISFIGIYFLYVYAINPHLKEGNFFKSDMNKGIWYLVRIAPISITIAHGFGRIGCLFAGCCHGEVTEEWYGIWNDTLQAKTVPIQLYEALFLFLISAVMIVLLFKFHFKHNMSVYLIGYGVWRFIIEYFRADYRGDFIPGLSPSQFWSIVMVIIGVALIFIYRYFDKKISEKETQKAQELEQNEKGA